MTYKNIYGGQTITTYIVRGFLIGFYRILFSPSNYETRKYFTVILRGFFMAFKPSIFYPSDYLVQFGRKRAIFFLSPPHSKRL